MMKMNKKYSIVAVALIALMCAGTAYALISIQSNIVSVNLSYKIHLDAAYVIGTGMNLNAYVTDSDDKGVFGLTVKFYASANGGAWTWIGDGIYKTNGDGYDTFCWTGIETATTYDFKATCTL
jgi:hypothetical protein